MSEDPKPAKFDSGKAKQQRIDAIKIRMHECRLERDFEGWLTMLMAWSSEMSSKYMDEEKTTVKQFVSKSRAAMHNTVREAKYYQKAYNVAPIIDTLDEFTQYLEMLEDKLGFGMPARSKRVM